MGRYTFFWGCQIPARLPFMEKSTRLVLDKLGVDIVEPEGFTCCPEKALIKNMDEETWQITAARNLAVAEGQGPDLVTACNGCYGTLRSVATKLNDSVMAREDANAKLALVDLEYQGNLKIKHLLEVLHDDVGPAKLKKLVQRPLLGMKIAVHYGCHMLRPSSAIHFDDPLNPSKFDVLVQALGAESLDYHTKMMCCGGALGHAGDLEDNIALTRKKLLEIEKLGADALVLFCPSCFMQYDQKQFMVQRRGEKVHIPVFTFPELVALAMGLPAEELGLEGHRVDVEPFFKKWDKHLADLNLVKKHLDLASVQRCHECQACVADCPVAEIKEYFNPQEIIGKLLEGKVQEVLEMPEVWYCVECHTCYELCPQRFGMEKVFTTLKHLAMERGLTPAPMKGGVDTFLKTGRLGEADPRGRKKLGLPETPAGGKDQLLKLLAAIKGEESPEDAKKEPVKGAPEDSTEKISAEKSMDKKRSSVAKAGKKDN